MYNKIPNILPDRYFSKVINKNKIIMFLKSENNVDKIEKYVEHNTLVLKNYPQYKNQDIVDILEECNYRINKIKGIDKLPEVVENSKKEVSNLNNVEVIYTPYFINDKNNEGFRHDITYVKLNNELYEIRNVNRIMSFLSNKEIIKDMSEYEIHKFIKENSDLIKTNYLDRQDGKINSEQVEEEIKNESDTKIRNALERHKNDVVKERQKLEEYISKNNSGASVQYGVNSNEERIYTVGDKLIKFEGPNRELQILSELDIETMRRDFESEQGYNNNLSSEKLTNIKEFEIYEDELTELIERQYKEVTLPDDQLEFLINFLEVWITDKENDEEIIESLNMVAQDWYEKVSIDSNILETSEELYKIFDRIKDYKKNYDKPKMLEVNNAAFVSIFAILESSLLIALITALLKLFK